MTSMGSNSQGLDSAQELWRHPDPEQSQMWGFIQRVNEEHGLDMRSYKELHQWSIDHISDFWAAVWDYVFITSSEPYKEVCS